MVDVHDGHQCAQLAEQAFRHNLLEKVRHVASRPRNASSLIRQPWHRSLFNILHTSSKEYDEQDKMQAAHVLEEFLAERDTTSELLAENG